MNPLAHVRMHWPALQVVVAFAAEEQAAPHPPQLRESPSKSIQLESHS